LPLDDSLLEKGVLGDGFVKGCGVLTPAVASSWTLGSLMPFSNLSLALGLTVRSLTPEKQIQKAGKLNEVVYL